MQKLPAHYDSKSDHIFCTHFSATVGTRICAFLQSELWSNSICFLVSFLLWSALVFATEKTAVLCFFVRNDTLLPMNAPHRQCLLLWHVCLVTVSLCVRVLWKVKRKKKSGVPPLNAIQRSVHTVSASALKPGVCTLLCNFCNIQRKCVTASLYNEKENKKKCLLEINHIGFQASSVTSFCSVFEARCIHGLHHGHSSCYVWDQKHGEELHVFLICLSLPAAMCTMEAMSWTRSWHPWRHVQPMYSISPFERRCWKKCNSSDAIVLLLRSLIAGL